MYFYFRIGRHRQFYSHRSKQEQTISKSDKISGIDVVSPPYSVLQLLSLILLCVFLSLCISSVSKDCTSSVSCIHIPHVRLFSLSSTNLV